MDTYLKINFHNFDLNQTLIMIFSSLNSAILDYKHKTRKQNQ